MHERDHHQEIMLSRLARNRELIEELQQKTRAIEQLLAQRKDALRGGYVATHTSELGPGERSASLAELKQQFGLVTDPKRPAPAQVLFVVEDDPDDYILLTNALHRAAVEPLIRWATSSANALRMIAELPAGIPLFLLLDVGLPGRTQRAARAHLLSAGETYSEQA